MATPRLKAVMCSSPAGLHRMAYTEWGDPSNKKIVLCVHGLTRTGRDFDVLAKRLAQDYRVVCPDVVGRGMSDRLANPAFYAIPQYAADMVNLVDRLQPSELHWVGTSMGGLIGLAYAGALALSRVQQQTLTPAQHYSNLPSTGVRLDRLVLNDVGPHLEPVSLERIGQYVGEAIEFASFQDAVQYVKKTAASFGPHTKAQWQELTRYTYIEQNGRWIKHYDLGLAAPFKSMTPEEKAVFLKKQTKLRKIALVIFALAFVLFGVAIFGSNDETTTTVTPSSNAIFSGRILSSKVINPATVQVKFEITNSGTDAGIPSCIVRVQDASNTYKGFDSPIFDYAIEPNSSITGAVNLTVTKEGAFFVTQGEVSCN